MSGFMKQPSPSGWERRGSFSNWDEIGLVVLILLVVVWAVLVAIAA